MDASANSIPVFDSLKNLTDDELLAVIEESTRLRAVHKNERQERAIAEIKRLARENELEAKARKRRRKPGRPPNAEHRT